MASRVFKNEKEKIKTVTNRAGGKAVELSDKETLAKYIVTCTFNDTYYATAKEHVEELKDVISRISDTTFLAKCAVYSRKVAGLKDMPAFLLNVLYVSDHEMFDKVFPKVIDSGRMLRTFVSVARSPFFNRNLSSRVMRRVFQRWFDSKSGDWLFSNSLGSDPSFKDIIRMTHVKGNKNQDLFSYILGKEYNVDNLPENLKSYLAWQKDRSLDLPEVNFRLLDSYKLSTNEWTKVMRSCSWNTLRMNLATFTRQEVFKSRDNLKYACEKLQSEMPKNVFPYEVFAAYKMNEDNLMLANVLNEVMEKSIENLPEIKGKTLIAVDVSASMSSKLSDKSSMKCIDVAAMFGACISRKCESSRVVTFDTDIRSDTTNSKDSILTLAKKLSANGGGTSISSVLDYIEVKNIKVDNVIIISDNESWADRSSWQGSTFADKWNRMTTRGMKLISIDLVPNAYTNAPTSRKNNLCVSGFNDSVWGVIKNFLENSENFTCQIDKTVL